MRPLLSSVVLAAQSDKQLVALAREGQDQAFVAIAHRYRRELLAHARRMTSADRAEDIVQQAMLSAWAALGREVDVLDERAWLHQIVHNTAIRVAKRSDRTVELTAALASTSRTDIDAELRMEAHDALAALAALPLRQRRALELTALGGSSGREAAEVLGVSEGMLRQLVHRARTALRSAAAALIPAPLLNWALASSSEPATARITEICASAGLAATVTKIGATLAVTASIVGGAGHWLLRDHTHGHVSGAALSPISQPGAGKPRTESAAGRSLATSAGRAQSAVSGAETRQLSTASGAGTHQAWQVGGATAPGRQQGAGQPGSGNHAAGSGNRGASGASGARGQQTVSRGQAGASGGQAGASGTQGAGGTGRNQP